MDSYDLDDQGSAVHIPVDYTHLLDIDSDGSELGFIATDFTDPLPDEQDFAPPEPVSAYEIPDLTPVVEPAPPAADDVHGTPDAYSDNWFYQEKQGYCGPSSAAQILSEYTGLDIKDPDYLANRVTELGLWSDGDPGHGMTLRGVETLLDDQCVPCHIERHGTLDDLTDKLDAGYGVIAMVDSGEIWHRGDELGEDDTADHVLVVTAIDEARGVVVLSDSGNPNGDQLTVPIEQFLDAWADSDNAMIVADEPDPDLGGTPGVDPAVTAVERDRWVIVDLIHEVVDTLAGE
ncbi:C39 family peptidase [Aldersonia sp. NBC_00410]|uniref:C39 family peptidase n=1 Tax=Aldersonia sp. NBC_00410 TaxID=2975954 RepID=UPI00225B078D|nr:C39 family peptidase [Aldersonia sp. NBC_00410]MCX5044854.1 C39 family peptidase [Aldersonia sp. NBC_00410]